jgi:hypothetical protein
MERIEKESIPDRDIESIHRDIILVEGHLKQI